MKTLILKLTISILAILFITLHCSEDQAELTVSADPEAGSYYAEIKVTLTASDDTATIYYSTDGEQPTSDSEIYREEIPITATTTLKYFAVATVNEEGVNPFGEESKRIESDVYKDEYLIIRGDEGILPSPSTSIVSSSSGDNSNNSNSNENSNSNNNVNSNSNMNENIPEVMAATYSVSITLPDDYTMTTVPTGLTASGGVVSGILDEGSSISFTATHPCKANITYGETVSADVQTTLTAGSNKNVVISITSTQGDAVVKIDGVTVSANSATVTCGSHLLTATSESQTLDLEKSITVAAAGETHTINWGGITFTPTLPTASFTKYGEHDIDLRTLTFSHSGTSVECSHDGGTTWATCDSAGTVIWTKADFDESRVIKVKASKTGEPDHIYSLTPVTHFSGITLLACDETVSSTETFGDFDGRFTGAAAGTVICIDKGVEITSDGSVPIQRPDDSISIVGAGTGNDRPHFNNTATSNYKDGFDWAQPSNGRDGTYYIGHIRITTTGTSANAIEVNAPSSSTILFENIDIVIGNSGAGFYIYDGVTATINSCTSTAETSAENYGVRVYGGNVTVNGGSFKTNNASAAYVNNGGTLTANGVTFETTNDWKYPVMVWNNGSAGSTASATFNDCIIKTN